MKIKHDSSEKQITEYIFINNFPKKADVAVVMGTSKTINEAVQNAAELYKAGVVPLIIVTGGDNARIQKNEAQVISQKLVELGIPPANILQENRATNTLENVLFTKELIDNEIGFANLHSIIAVTRNYHSRRVLMTFNKHFPDSVALYASGYESERFKFSKNTWNKSEVGKEKVLEELGKIEKYLEKGDLAELEL